MSRNGPYGQPRAPQRRNPAEHDPYANGQAGQWPQQGGGYPDGQHQHGQHQLNGGPQGYGANGGHPGYNGGQQGFAPQQQQHAQGGYHYPQAPEPEPQQQYYPQQGQHGQMAGFDRYAAPTAPAQNGYQPQQGPQQGQWGQQDPRNYDLGSYTQPTGFGPAEPSPHFQHTPEPAPFSAGQQGFAEPEVDYDEGLAEDDEESHGGRRWVIITAALVGAICLGGGLAYTYKMLFTSGSNRPSIAKAIDGPGKIKATSGRENAQVDKKLFTRLGDEGGTATDKPEGTAEAQQDDRQPEGGVGGPRPVRIIPITPSNQGSGQLTTTTTTGTVTPTKPAGGQITVPGLMIDTGGPRGAYPQQGGGQITGGQVRPVIPQTTTTTTTEPVAPQKKVAVVTPNTPTNTPTSSVTGTSTPSGATKMPVPKTKETAAVNTPVSNGYVAVVSSQRSRMDAMKAYASMDQKYRDMLASSSFDVQEADLGEKGVWYRAVIGPPRSFEGAKKICDDLKAAGYPSCWPARY